MIIRFDKNREQVMPNFKGGEKEFHVQTDNDGMNKIMYGCLVPGASIGLHTHETNSEVIYFIEGTGKVLYDGEYLPLKAGECHYCPKGHTHSLINDSDANLVFFAVVPEQ